MINLPVIKLESNTEMLDTRKRVWCNDERRQILNFMSPHYFVSLKNGFTFWKYGRIGGLDSVFTDHLLYRLFSISYYKPTYSVTYLLTYLVSSFSLITTVTLVTVRVHNSLGSFSDSLDGTEEFLIRDVS